MSYYNTTNETGKQLTLSWDKSKSQEDLILEFFVFLDANCKGVDAIATPFEVWAQFNDKYPLTSIRRAMSDLTAAGKIVKTSIQRKGKYNKVNFCWKLNKGEE
tara:strand:+ start:1935 stop:2243 length:309 start_codon:yes stop_codon:yes gene_type:complete